MKSESVQLRFDYAALDAETRRYVEERAERIHNLARMTAAGIVQIGQYLAEVKERLKHGQFLEWIEREFGWGRSSADRFMDVFERVKLPNLGNLEIDVSALYLIAAPKTPEPVRTEALRRAANGEPVTHAATRELVRRFAETGEMPDIQVSLKEMIAQKRRELCVPPAPMTREERAEEERRRKEVAENTQRNAALMGSVQSIVEIARSQLSISALARYIKRFDTPDVNWRGAVKEAQARLKELSKELQV